MSLSSTVARITASPRARALLTTGLLTGLLVMELVLASDAEARVGGGSSWSSGRSSGRSYSGGGSSYSSSHSSGGGGEGELLMLLIHLLIRYPTVGIPLVLVVGLFFLFNRNNRSARRWSNGDAGALPPPRPADRSRVSLRDLARVDSGFSEPVFLDFIQLIHRRATEVAAGGGEREALTPFVAPGAWDQLQTLHRGVSQVEQVILGSVEVASLDLKGPRQRLRVLLKSNRLWTREGKQQRVYMEELWTFQRSAGAVSLPPEDTLRLGCPSCGAAVETDPMGACTHCGTPITKGQLQWQLAETSLTRDGQPRIVRPPEVGRSDGGDEPSVFEPTVKSNQLAVELRGLLGRHPDFKPKAFQQHVTDVYMALQSAWSSGAWGAARPHVTDALYQTLRFWMDGYAAAGMRNQLDEVQLSKMEIVRVEMDAWYEAITLRIWGSMRDYVVDRDGKVIGGNAQVSRRFSEYWTFIRAQGTGSASHDGGTCPSCGAPLDRVSQTGVCGYCDTKLSSGRFDWVLSRIDQPDVYRG
ncbi:MAG: TIM44-like domain-containing protein [Deltaproteobacteria bacterium]|nr:TIM44-like domain-containing protein [Deltaproteobacteria bacterium]